MNNRKRRHNRLDPQLTLRRKRRLFAVFASVLTAVLLELALVVTGYQNTHPRETDFLSAAGPALREAFRYPERFVRHVFGKYTPGGLLACGFADLAVCGLLWYDDVRHRHDLSGIENGSARWESDYRGFAVSFTDPDSRKNIILSERLALNMDTRKTLRNNNVLVIGGSGSGKTRSFVKPNVLQRNCNYVITDPSGEILESTGKSLADDGYEIKVFNLVEQTRSNRYNPFRYIRSDAGVMMMVNCLIRNTTPPEQHGTDPFWEKSEVALLLALCFYLRDNRPESDRNFSTVTELLRWAEIDELHPKFESRLDRIFLRSSGQQAGRKARAGENVESVMGDPAFVEWLRTTTWTDSSGVRRRNDGLLSLEELDTEGTSIAVKQYKTFKMGAGKTEKSILISCAVRLSAFNIPEIARLTGGDDIHLEELGGIPTGEDRPGEDICDRQALFVIIPAADSTFNFLVSMMYSQLFETLYFVAETKCTGQRLGRHVRFILDEFANIGTIPEFTKKLATMRKYEISCSVILQNLAQIRTMYRDDWESIVGNSDTILFLGGKEYTTLEYLSKELGNQTIVTRSRSMSSSVKGGRTNSSYQSVSRPLMMPDELGEMDDGKCVVMIRGLSPFLDAKYDYVSHRDYRLTGDADRESRYVNVLDTFASAEKEDTAPGPGEENTEPLPTDNAYENDDPGISLDMESGLQTFERQYGGFFSGEA